MFAAGPISFSVVPSNKTERTTLELVLTRKAQSASSYAPETTGLAVRVSLPAAGEEGRKDAFVLLGTSDTGRRLGWGQALEPSFDIPTSSLQGTWAESGPHPCSTSPRSEEVCIPGGAFWMGDPELRGNADLDDSDRERLTVLSPFFLDRQEVTVAEFRESWPNLEAAGLPPPPLFSGQATGEDPDDYATFTYPAPTGEDVNAMLPVNGVPWRTARAYCQALGKDLPTEAMFEYVASGLGNEWPYVWGLDAPDCEAAAIARAGFGYYANFDGSCRAPGTIGGPEFPGSHARDAIELEPEQVVLDLAGSLTEWTLDAQRTQPKASARSPVSFDPVVEPTDGPVERVVKGGSWRGRLVEARAGAHSARDPEQQNRSIGFRCARSDAVQ
jgi:formylglycine-generating enzyme required for sulfatase activity